MDILTVKFTSLNVDTSLLCDGGHLCCFRLLNKEFYFNDVLFLESIPPSLDVLGAQIKQHFISVKKYKMMCSSKCEI